MRQSLGHLALLASLLGGVHLSRGVEEVPLCGIHTIRADDTALSMIREAGCSFVLQHLDWSQTEPLPGEYFWEYPDFLIRACEYYGLDLVLRLDRPPAWAVASGVGRFPVDVDAYSAFVGRVAERYRGRVEAYVIWNEPNLAREWGGQQPDPAGYVELLRVAHIAAKTSDPGALVVSAGLAPTNHRDETAMDDRVYLQRMYDAGAGSSFDVLGLHPYGFAYGPEDPHDAHQGLNLARLTDLREIMVRNGDGRKPAWATELGWTTESASEEQVWLQVSEAEQAAYLVGAFGKAAQEWPWLERIAVWNLSSGLEAHDEKRGYSIVASDYQTRPAYEALCKMAKSSLPGRFPGVAPRNGLAEILAPDVVIRLGDVDTFHPHWVRIYGGQAPSRHWQGGFYMPERPAGRWRLTMEIMQVEEQGNLVSINGQLLEPRAIPLRGKVDFASSWTTASLDVPPGVLRPGLNVVEVAASPRWPVYQDSVACFESLQLRNVRLLPSGSG